MMPLLVISDIQFQRRKALPMSDGDRIKNSSSSLDVMAEKCLKEEAETHLPEFL